jgi:hypothetical protein
MAIIVAVILFAAAQGALCAAFVSGCCILKEVFFMRNKKERLSRSFWSL